MKVITKMNAIEIRNLSKNFLPSKKEKKGNKIQQERSKNRAKTR